MPIYCSIGLHYDDKRDLYWCLSCGYNRPTDFDNTAVTNQSGNTTAAKLKTATSSDKDAAAADPDNIPIASKGTRTEELEKRKSDDGWDWLCEKDDARLEKMGYSLMSDEITFNDNKTTKSAEDLERERLARNEERGRSKIVFMRSDNQSLLR